MVITSSDLMNSEELYPISQMLKRYGKYIIWMDKSEEWDRKAFNDVDELGQLVLSPEDKSNHIGDDWDDSPANSNAGTPYSGSTLIIDKKTKIYTYDDMINFAVDIYNHLKPNTQVDNVQVDNN